MSTHFTIRCGLHEVDGPDLRRQAGGITFAKSEGGQMVAAVEDASAFLIEHEYCGDLRLIHE